MLYIWTYVRTYVDVSTAHSIVHVILCVLCMYVHNTMCCVFLFRSCAEVQR